MANGNSDWDQRFAAAIHGGDLASILAVLDEQRTAHAGTPPRRVKDRALRLIREVLADQPARQTRLGFDLAGSDNDGGKEIGVLLLAPLAVRSDADRDAILAAIQRAADDQNWEVREWAASALAVVVADRSALMVPVLQSWTSDPSPNIRRAAAVGIGWAAKRLDADSLPAFLTILNPLLADDAPYVTKNLGPFAIGNDLLSTHPVAAASWLRAHTADDRPRVRWNVTMALSTAVAGRLFSSLPDLSAILTDVAADDRPLVRRAAIKAATNLARRSPDTVLPILRGWRADSLRAPVAEQALAKIEASCCRVL